MDLQQLKTEHEALLLVTDFTATPEVYIHQSGKIQETSRIIINGGVGIAKYITKFLNENKDVVLQWCQQDAELQLKLATLEEVEKAEVFLAAEKPKADEFEASAEYAEIKAKEAIIAEEKIVMEGIPVTTILDREVK